MSPLHLHFFDAGKADSALISYQSDTTTYNILIDTGESNLASTLLKYFSKHKITKLDALIITHFDKDHVGSAAEIINNFDVETVFQTNTTKDSDTYRDYLEALSDKNIAPITISADSDYGDHYIFYSDEFGLEIFGPEKTYSKKESNNSSLITCVSFRDKKFLFMGDAEDDRLEDFLELDSIAGDYELIKVPYHGHYQSSLKTLVETVRAKHAVITSSYTELEDSETIRLFADSGAEVHLTREGALDFHYD